MELPHMNKSASQTHSPFARFVFSHARAFRFALIELTRAPIVNFITVCVIAIAIALPLGFFIIMKNFQAVNSSWNASAPTISLYLKPNTAQADIDSLMQTLHANTDIAKINYISSSDGLKTFEKNTPFS